MKDFLLLNRNEPDIISFMSLSDLVRPGAIDVKFHRLDAHIEPVSFLRKMTPAL